MYSDYCSPPSSPSSSPLSLFMQLYIFLTHTQGESIKTKLESIICKQKASKEKNAQRSIKVPSCLVLATYCLAWSLPFSVVNISSEILL